MSHRRSTAFAAMLLSAPLGSQVTAARADWVPLGQVDIASPSAILFDPKASNTILWGADSGLYQSIDGGATWSLVPIPTDQPAIGSIARDTQSGRITVNLQSQETITTSDRGADWYSVLSLPVYEPVFTLDPKVARRVWATTGADLYQSADGANSFKDLSAAAHSTAGFYGPLAIDARPAQTIYGLTSYQSPTVLKSVDGGKTTTVAYTSQGSVSAVAAAPSGAVYLSQIEGASVPGGPVPVLTSTDQGSTWKSFSKGLNATDQITHLAVDPKSQSVVYAGGSYGADSCGLHVFSSNAWHCAAVAGQRVVEQLATSRVGGGTISYGNGRLDKTTTAGKTWAALTGKGLPQSALIDLVSPRTGSVAYATTANGVFRTADSGKTWSSVDIHLPASFYATGSTNGLPRADAALDSAASPSVLYVSNFQSLYQSKDEGKTFQVIALPKVSGTSIRLGIVGTDPGDAGRLWVSLEDTGSPQDTIYSFESEDYGKSWHAVDYPSRVIELIGDPNSKTLRYVLTNDGLFSSSNGTSWRFVLGDAPNVANQIVVAGKPTVIAVEKVEAVPCGPYCGIETISILRSSDGGKSFTSYPAPWNTTATLSASPDGSLFFASAGTSVYVSRDGAKTWETLPLNFVATDGAISLYPTGDSLIADYPIDEDSNGYAGAIESYDAIGTTATTTARAE